jgi:hypothetical protein
MIRLEAEFKAVRLFYVQQVTDVLTSCYRRHVAVKKPAAENGEWVRGRTKGSARCRLERISAGLNRDSLAGLDS